MEFDLLVIGGGTAGIGAAKAARDLGAKVAVAEPEALGGT
jgi:glutathione reductase (NADPH)